MTPLGVCQVTPLTKTDTSHGVSTTSTWELQMLQWLYEAPGLCSNAAWHGAAESWAVTYLQIVPDSGHHLQRQRREWNVHKDVSVGDQRAADSVREYELPDTVLMHRKYLDHYTMQNIGALNRIDSSLWFSLSLFNLKLITMGRRWGLWDMSRSSWGAWWMRWHWVWWWRGGGGCSRRPGSGPESLTWSSWCSSHIPRSSHLHSPLASPWLTVCPWWLLLWPTELLSPVLPPSPLMSGLFTLMLSKPVTKRPKSSS